MIKKKTGAGGQARRLVTVRKSGHRRRRPCCTPIREARQQTTVKCPGKEVRSRIPLFFFQAEDGIRDATVTGVQTCALPIWIGTTAVESYRDDPLCQAVRR